MAGASDAVMTTLWPTSSFYYSDDSSTWVSNVTEYNNVVGNSTNDNRVSEPVQIFLPCNNPENLIDEETGKQVEHLLQIILLPSLELFGVITNVINCVVFVKQGLRDRINLCLFSLALADTSFLLLMFTAKFYSFLSLFDKDAGEYWSQKHLNTVLGPLFATMNISNLMTMIISVERCICVLSPFTAKKFLKTRYMAIGIAIMASYVFGFYSLLDMKYVTLQVTDPVRNESRWVSHLSTFYKDNKVVILILYNHLLSLTIPCASLVVVIVTTSITINRLRTTMAWRLETANKASSGDRRGAAVTKMLTVVCFVYVATITPSVTQSFFKTLIPGYIPSGKLCNTFSVVQTLAHACEVTNSSVNFIIYFSMGSKFRDTVRDLFGTGRGKPSPAETSLATVSQEVQGDVNK